jgi:hypothetical protein
MNQRLHLIHSGIFFLCALVFISCSGVPEENGRLEITGLRYDSSETPRCVGDIKNISAQPLSNLKIEVEFRTENGGRVRGSILDLPGSTLAPNASANFSAPYVKGANDSQVSACGVLRIRTQEGETLPHIERRAK